MEGVFPAKWKLSIIANCYQRKMWWFRKRKPEETEINRLDSEDTVKKLIWQQVDNNEMQFGFAVRCGTANGFFYFETVAEEILKKKEKYVLCICRYVKSFW